MASQMMRRPSGRRFKFSSATGDPLPDSSSRSPSLLAAPLGDSGRQLCAVINGHSRS